jgi:antitoxin VapB
MHLDAIGYVGMGLYIRDDGVRELAARLAERRHCTLTDAVRQALEEKLLRLDEERDERVRKTREIQARVAAMPDLRPGFTDHDLYDEDGNPIL